MNATQLLGACSPDALCSEMTTVTYGPALAVLFAIVLMLVGTWYRHHHLHRTAYHRTVHHYPSRNE
ncbi:hypothetical protein [Arthrobacter sp.]|uniref:hypothetical protein n=1 Tax=Arthrobacter sp. TaxID=1667 RepID=UPI003A91496E